MQHMHNGMPAGHLDVTWRKSARSNPVEPHSGHEELRKPDGGYDRRHTDVRLLYQHPDDDQEQRNADQIAGKAGAQLLLRK